MFACCDWLFARCWPTFERGFCNQNFDSSIQNDAIQCAFMQTNATIHATQTTCAATQTTNQATTKCNNNDQTTRTTANTKRSNSCKYKQREEVMVTADNQVAATAAAFDPYEHGAVQPEELASAAHRGAQTEREAGDEQCWFRSRSAGVAAAPVSQTAVQRKLRAVRVQ
jgi:hypothetical protein